MADHEPAGAEAPGLAVAKCTVRAQDPTRLDVVCRGFGLVDPDEPSSIVVNYISV